MHVSIMEKPSVTPVILIDCERSHNREKPYACKHYGQLSPISVCVWLMKEFTLETSLIHISSVKMHLPAPVI